MGVRAQARHPVFLEPVPQRPDRPLGSPIEEQADGQGHGSVVQVNRLLRGLLDPRRCPVQ
jgi:hypothetical protein